VTAKAIAVEDFPGPAMRRKGDRMKQIPGASHLREVHLHLAQQINQLIQHPCQMLHLLDLERSEKSRAS
jgi:predicted secreted protein